jgi:uncharacterized membrane protein
MIVNCCAKVRNLILAAVLISGLGLVSHATAQESHSYLIDSNSRTATDLGTLDGENSCGAGINDDGQVWDIPIGRKTRFGSPMPSLPAP